MVKFVNKVTNLLTPQGKARWEKAFPSPRPEGSPCNIAFLKVIGIEVINPRATSVLQDY